MNSDLVKYYKDRANEYEKIYSKPERQEELLTSSTILQDLFTNKTVFEVACGTGYWTERLASKARSVFATDINETVIEIAKRKQYPNLNVTLQVADLFNYSSPEKYDSLFAGFIWSHIKKQELAAFIEALRAFIAPGGFIVIMDNNYIKNSNHPITKTDEQGNTFQTRKLEDGTSHLVLKNFPTQSYLQETLGKFGEAKLINLTYFWIAILKINI